mgnify:CR=1 FL=1
MDFEEQIELSHLLLTDRKCVKCGKNKNLVDSFYRTRKDRGHVPSSYSYECKECTIKRVLNSRSCKPDVKYEPVPRIKDVYPDW